MKYREYLPEFLREIEDFRGLEEGFGPETERFREKSAAAADECCAETAGEAGIERFERMLGLPAGDMDLEQRRGQVLGRLRDLPPYSAGWLYRKLRMLCGEDGFLLEEDAENLRLRIGVPGDRQAGVRTLHRSLRESIPANVELHMGLLFRESGSARFGAWVQTGERIEWRTEQSGTV